MELTVMIGTRRTLMRRSQLLLTFLTFGALTAAGPYSRAASLPTQPATTLEQKMWANHVQPILAKNCGKCHGGERQKGGLDLRDLKAIFAGGTDGAVVIPGRPGESPLYQRLMVDSDEHMPPR